MRFRRPTRQIRLSGSIGSENSHGEQIGDTFYIFSPTQEFYARRMFRWDAIAHLRQRFTAANSHKCNIVPEMANATSHFDKRCIVLIRREVGNHPDNVWCRNSQHAAKLCLVR